MATNLVASDANEASDAFVRTRWARAPWDINGDGVVDTLDIGRIGQHWQATGAPGWLPEDVNHDGWINSLDVGLVGLHWQETV